MIVTIHQSNCPTSKTIWIWILVNQKISFFYSARSCSIHHLELLSNKKTAFHLPSCIFDQSETSCPPPHLSPLHRTLTFTLLSSNRLKAYHVFREGTEQYDERNSKKHSESYSVTFKKHCVIHCVQIKSNKKYSK